jgi:presenilin 1
MYRILCGEQGLGLTLLLLDIYKTALPALPISIFGGVFFYLITRVVIVPYLEEFVGDPLWI